MKRHMDIFLEWVLVILLCMMVLDVFWGVFTRYILENQSSWTDELARFLLIWLSILGAAYASGKNLHIAIDLLPQYLSERNKKILDIVINSIILFFVISVFLVGGLRYLYISFALGQTSPALDLPIGFVYMVLPIAGLFIAYYKMDDLLTTIKNLKTMNNGS